jgi:mevalonate kinase
MSVQTYHGKLLLFGEHTILRGSKALARPLPLYSGHWAYSEAIAPAHSLEGYVAHLYKQEKTEGLLAKLQLSAFEREVNKGLYFASDIPVGYGAGSSGALCAAVYERFASNPIGRGEEERYTLLKSQLAQLESYFHGASSGTDPLICYLNRPVVLFPDGHVLRISLPLAARAQGHFFLLDTGLSRKTGGLVGYFLKQCELPAFAAAVSEALVPATEAAIESYLAADGHLLAQAIRRLSALQLEYLEALIPTAYRQLWAAGLDSGDFAFKLCGAGGGGFILGYTLHPEAARARLGAWQPIWLEKI